MDKIVYNAVIAREQKGNIEDEIAVLPEFKDIFTNKHSLVGNQGRMIKEFRIKHKSKPKKYKKRKKYSVYL